MLKIQLGPLDAKVAQVLASLRGITVTELMINLLREEAAIEITHWRNLKDEPQSVRLAKLADGDTDK